MRKGPSARVGSKPRERRVLTSANGPRRKDEYVSKEERRPPAPARAAQNPVPGDKPRRPSLSNKPPPKGMGAPGAKPPPRGMPPPPKPPPKEFANMRPPPPKPNTQRRGSHDQTPKVPPPPPRPDPPVVPIKAPSDDEDDEEDGYGDDSFEDYDDDDFEDDDDEDEDSAREYRAPVPAPVPAPAPARRPPPPPPPKAAVAQESEAQPDWMNVGPAPVEISGIKRPSFAALNLSMSHPYPKRCFEQAPISDHDQLVRHIGVFASTSNQLVQTVEESKEIEVQTEDLEPQDQGCQAPDDLAAGGSSSYLSASGPASLKRQFDPVRFSNFLRSASQTITTLLAECASANEAAKNRKIDEVQGNLALTMGCVTLPPAPLGGHRPIEDFCFSQYQQHLLLVAYGPPEYAVQRDDTIEQIARKIDVNAATLLSMNKSRYKNLTETSKLQPGSWITVPPDKAATMPSSTGGKGLLCLWDINSLAHPVAIMVCESYPTKCCFSNQHSSMTTYAVTADGSVVAWDLRESPTMHISCKMPGGYGIVLRRPSYSTDGLMENAHIGRIKCLQTIALNNTRANTDKTVDQLATLDEDGGLVVWIVMELDRADNAGSETDLCLGIGSKIKIIKNYGMDLSHGSIMCCFDLAFRPGNSNDVLVGTGEGNILHSVRHGRQAAPAKYQGPGICDVLSIEFSPHLPDYFLAAFSNGTVMLYHQESPVSIRSWGGFSQHKIKAALWMPSQPQNFIVYDIQGQAFVFNLLKDVNFPVTMAHLDAKSSSGGLASLRQVQVSPRGVGHASMATSYTDGTVNIHTLSGVYSDSAVADVHRMQALLEGKEYIESEYVNQPLPSEQKTIQNDLEVDTFGGDDMLGDMFGVVGSNARKAKSGRRARN